MFPDPRRNHFVQTRGEWDLSGRTELKTMLTAAEADYRAAKPHGRAESSWNHPDRCFAASQQVTRIFGMCFSQLQTLFGLADPTSAALVGNTFVKSAAFVSPFATA